MVMREDGALLRADSTQVHEAAFAEPEFFRKARASWLDRD